jgi:signal transduction histidine kinase
VEEFGPQARDAGIDLTVTTCADSDRRSEPQQSTEKEALWARADAGGLQIALRNLLSNAIKYTDLGGEVRVRVWSEDEMVLVEVEDTGIGMDPETVSRLFESFKQASEGIGRKYEGTGLGLTVTREVLDQMGGTIEVETEPGVGSRFTVRLPRAHQPDEDVPSEELASEENVS